jgi:hypothetical protein
LFDDDEENSRFHLEEENATADWFGSFSPSPSNLFGGLNPKQPDAFSNIPVGAVFNWEEKQSEALSPFGSLYGSTDYYNYDFGNSIGMDSGVESKDNKEIKECQIMYNNSSSSNNNSSEMPTSFKAKQDNTILNVADQFKVKKADTKNKRSKKIELNEKRKRGRPRLNTGQELVVPKYVDDVNLSARALAERPSHPYKEEDESLVTIGTYSKAVRRAKIERFKAKKLHTLQYGPLARFEFRKQFAGARPRVGGRFIKMYSDPFLGPPQALGVDSDSDMALSRDELLSDEETQAPETEFRFSPESEREAMNLSGQPNDPYFNDLINQYAALFTGPHPNALFTGPGVYPRRPDPRGALFPGRPTQGNAQYPDPRHALFNHPEQNLPPFPFSLNRPFSIPVQ